MEKTYTVVEVINMPVHPFINYVVWMSNQPNIIAKVPVGRR